MNKELFDDGARLDSAPSNPYLLPIFILSVSHSSHHHEHSAH